MLSRSALTFNQNNVPLFTTMDEFIEDGCWNSSRLLDALGDGIATLATEIQVNHQLSRDTYVWGEECYSNPKASIIYKSLRVPSTGRGGLPSRIWKVRALPSIPILNLEALYLQAAYW